jgi:endonuclease YncB( thermonuclease family)
MSLAALEALIAGLKVRCEVVERDDLVANAFSLNGVDIGRRLVLAGWALAYRWYSRDDVDAENEARKARRGMWRGTFMKPWQWRITAPRPQASTPSAPAGTRRQPVGS